MPPWIAPKVTTAGSLRDVGAAADDGLRGDDQSAAATIGSTPPHGREPCVCRPFTLMREAVGRGHQRAAAHADLAGLQRGEHMQAEHRLGLEVLEQAFLEHQRRAAVLAGGRAFLGGLEHEHHLARQVARASPPAPRRRPAGCAVWASWPQACITPTVSPLKVAGDLRGERQVGLLGHRQRVHVGAQRDPRAGLAALEDRDHAVVGDAGLRLEAERAQVLGDLGRGALSRGCPARGAGGSRGASRSPWPAGGSRRRPLPGVRQGRRRPGRGRPAAGRTSTATDGALRVSTGQDGGRT